MAKKISIAGLCVLILAFILVAVSRYLDHEHKVGDAADRHRWLREIDRGNAESGFITDTNRDMVFVGVTNALTWWTNQASSK